MPESQARMLSGYSHVPWVFWTLSPEVLHLALEERDLAPSRRVRQESVLQQGSAEVSVSRRIPPRLFYFGDACALRNPRPSNNRGREPNRGCLRVHPLPGASPGAAQRIAAARQEASRLAWEPSPLASVETWRSPVLLVQGDDDRNVPFSEMVRLVEALRKQKVEFHQLVFPNEIHDFLRHSTWLAAYHAASDFFDQHLRR